jgi:hypothetical protein
MNAPTPSAELQAYKNMGVSYSYNFIVFIIINIFFSIKYFIVKIIYMTQLLKVQRSQWKIMHIIERISNCVLLCFDFVRMYLCR